MKKPKVLKKNRQLQRSDTTLNLDVVHTLVQRIFSGKTLYPKEHYILVEKEGEEPKKVNCYTIDKWICRNNVIPETGRTLRDVLNEARAEYRQKEREKRQESMVYEAERAVERTIRLRTNLPVVGMFGVVKDENGRIMRKENAGLLKIKMDTAEFLLERLNPEKYAKKETTENKHLIFSLSDLRKAKEARDANVPPVRNEK